jgi:hypothetical protein
MDLGSQRLGGGQQRLVVRTQLKPRKEVRQDLTLNVRCVELLVDIRLGRKKLTSVRACGVKARRFRRGSRNYGKAAAFTCMHAAHEE